LNYASITQNEIKIDFYLNDGKGKFYRQTGTNNPFEDIIVSDFSLSAGLEFGDLNNDNKYDILITARNGLLVALLQD